MWTSEVTQMIIKGIGETLYMVLASTAAGYLFGLPVGILLAVTDKDGINQMPSVTKYWMRFPILSAVFRF